MSAEPLVICTVAVRQQQGELLVLADEIARWQDEPLHVYAADDGWAHRAAGRIAIQSDAIDEALVHQCSLCSDGPDLAAALAPALVASLLERHRSRSILYLAPDFSIRGALDDVAALLEAHPVVLLARRGAPVPHDGCTPTPFELEQLGAFDAGFVGVAAGNGAFAREWVSSTLRLVAGGGTPAKAQRFFDGAPTEFGAFSLEDPAHGLAYWNADAHQLTWSETGYRIGEAELRSVHFAGFDPSTPHVLSSAAGTCPRARLSDSPALGRLCAERAEALDGVDVDPAEGVAGDEPNAPLIDERMRGIYRSALALALDEGTGIPPDPYAPGGLDAFYAFLASADPADISAPSLPRYLAALHRDRPDLLWTFPRVGTVDSRRFREWVEHHGLTEADVSEGLRRALAASPWWQAPAGVLVAQPDRLRSGIALAGYLRAEVGLGEVARLTLDVVAKANIDVSSIVVSRTESLQLGSDVAPPVADRLINVMFVNADQLLGFASVVGPEYFEGRYNVGCWVYETEQLGTQMGAQAALVDEIWVPSQHVRAAVEPFVDRPVHVFPYPVVVPPVDPAFDVKTLGIDRPFLLFTYDFLSSFRRKNPLGVLEGFRRAFDPGEGPLLVLKSVNGERRSDELEQLLLAAADRPDVLVIDRYLLASERGALLAASLAFVSLHRAEGFGMGMAEAMALGKPVVASAYSGNLDYMDDESAILVPVERVRVGEGAPPYDPNDMWGEPDLEAAAAAMRKIHESPAFAAALGARARRRILGDPGEGERVAFVVERVRDIERQLKRGYRSSSAQSVREML